MGFFLAIKKFIKRVVYTLYRLQENVDDSKVLQGKILAELNKSRKGQSLSQKVKEKIGVANTGRKRPDLAERNKKRKGMDIPRDESGKFIKKTSEQIISSQSSSQEKTEI